MPRNPSILLMTALLLMWMAGSAGAQPFGGIEAPEPARAKPLGSVEAPRSADAKPLGGVEAPSTPAQMRSRLLYGDGRGAFGSRGALRLNRATDLSTFQHSSPNGSARAETALAPPPFDRQVEDRWLAFDKVQHLTFSFLWTLGTQYVAVNKGRISERHALPLSITSSAVVGVSKEVYDLRIGPSRYFSKKDLAADALGILLATGLILL